MKAPGPIRRFFTWVRATLDMLCDRPDHLQRLSVIFAGMSLFPMMSGLVFLLVRYGDQSIVLAQAVVPILGNALYGIIGLFGLAIIALLGIIRGLKVGAFGADFEIETTSAPTTKTTTVTETT